MAEIDKRRDSAEFYPGGKVIPQRPVTPSVPTASFQQKGDDEYVYFKTDANGVKHYKKQVLQYDEDMEDYGAIWTGDYIVVNNEYVEVTA